MIDFALYLTYAMVAISILLAIGFSVWFLLKNFSNAKATLFGFAGIIIVFLMSYFISSNEVYEKFSISASLSQFIGGTLIMLYIIFFGTILTAIYAEVNKLFK